MPVELTLEVGECLETNITPIHSVNVPNAFDCVDSELGADFHSATINILVIYVRPAHATMPRMKHSLFGKCKIFFIRE